MTHSGMGSLFAAIISDVISVRRRDAQFFLPDVVQQWMREWDDEDFRLGVWELLRAERGRKVVLRSRFAHAVALWVSRDLSALCYRGDVAGEGRTAYSIRDIALRSARQREAIIARAVRALRRDAPLVIVETPLSLGVEEKEQYRKDIIDRYGYSSVGFRVNAELIGGIRMYINGVITDHSIQARIDTVFHNISINV